MLNVLLKGMPSRVITQSLYTALLVAYRENPGTYSVAARAVGVGGRFAKRAWEQGWLPRHPWAKAIKDVLEQEKIQARAEARRQEEAARRAGDADRSAAAKHAIDAISTEKRILQLMRGNIGQSLTALGTLMPGLRKVVEHLNTSLVNDPSQLTPKQAVLLIRDFAFATRALSNAGELTIRAEREHGGDPREVTGAPGGIDSDMTLPEAVRTIGEASALIELAKRRGIIAPDKDPSSEEPN